MDEICFKSYKYDPDVWFCSAMKDYGTDYDQYVLIYTDDILDIMQNSEDFIRHEIGKIFVMNTNSIGTPTQYLINKVSYVTIEDGQSAWRFSLYLYVQDAVKNVINKLAQEGWT